MFRLNHKSLEIIYKEHRELWNLLREMEKDSFNTFKPNMTMLDLEERFNKEEVRNVYFT